MHWYDQLSTYQQHAELNSKKTQPLYRQLDANVETQKSLGKTSFIIQLIGNFHTANSV